MTVTPLCEESALHDVTICSDPKIQINDFFFSAKFTEQVWGLCDCWVQRLFVTNTTCDNKIICHHSLFARASTVIKIRASADCCYLSGIRASPFCLDTRSPRHSCPPCPSQRQTCLQSPWHNLPTAQERGENNVQTEKLILLMHQVHLVYSTYDVVFCVKWKCAYWECRQKTKTLQMPTTWWMLRC